MLSEHFVENPHHCNKHNYNRLCHKLFNEAQYQKWLKKPIHTFGEEQAFKMFTEAVDRAMNLIQTTNDGIDYDSIYSKNALNYNPADNLYESYMPARRPRRFFVEGAAELPR